MNESTTPNFDGIYRSDKVTGFLCPDCDNSPLCVGTIGETQICLCPQCEGFVIDRASLGELIELLRSAYQGNDDPPRAVEARQLHERTRCPACVDVMDTFPYYGPSNVVIDTCEGCKLTWLDRGELSQIIRAPGRRDYTRFTGESEVLRKQLYAQAKANGNAALAILGGIFS